MASTTSKIMAMVSGHNRDEFDFNNIPVDERTKIDTAIESIFIGKSTLIWVDGGKLNDAWNSALEYVRQELFTVPNTSVRVAYLRQAVFDHRAKWTIKMTQSNERNSFAFFNSEKEKQETIEQSNEMIKTGFDTIKKILQSSGTAKTHSTKTINLPQREMVAMRENTNSRSHEYVHEHK